MSEKQPVELSEEEARIQREIREGRKFSLEEAIGRLAGPGLLKGQSPVAPLQQAEITIGAWLRTHLADGGGALEGVLHRRLKQSDLLLADFDEPLAVLARYCRGLLESESALAELVREADVAWGRLLGERPHLNHPGAAPHPDDPYTVDSVRQKLTDLVHQLEAEPPQTSAPGSAGG